MARQRQPVKAEGQEPGPFVAGFEASTLRSLASIVLLVAFAALMLALSWQRWSTPFRDVGRELYTAWSISNGAILYQDIWLPRGPLSSYWNALLFWLFGASMTSLAIANLSILAGGVILLHRAIQREYGHSTALVASFVFLSVFAFGRYGKDGNYNFVMPYAHEVTHGLVLSLVLMTLLLQALGSRRETDGRPAQTTRRPKPFFFAAGIALGLVMLTKQEIAIAATLATLATVVTDATISLRARIEGLGVIALGTSLPLATCLLLLGSAPFTMMWDLSISEVVRDNLFYQVNLGLDRPAEHLGRIGLATIALALELAIVAGIGRWLLGATRARVVAVSVAFALAHLAFFAYGPVPALNLWSLAPATLPVVVAAALLCCLAARLLAPGHEAGRPLLCWLAAFAALMLFKLGLYPRITHYGFVQALPAAILSVVVGLAVLPEQLARARVDGRFVRWAAAFSIVCFCLYSVSLERLAYASLDETTGSGGDLFHVQRRGLQSQRILERLQQTVEPGETLAVLPEGAVFNYLLRLRNPTPHISFMPFELMLTGEGRVVRDFAAHPPDYVLLLPRDVREHGFREFGQPGYGDRIIGWLRSSYDWPTDAPPRQPRLLRRRD